MDYRIGAFAKIWKNGIFNVPIEITDKYLKIASEYQLKALLFVLRNGGSSTTADIAKALGQPRDDVDDLMEFWVGEGIFSDCEAQAQPQKAEPADREVKPAPPAKQTLAPPRLTPKDVIDAARDSEEIAFLLNEAQVILGRTISHSEQEMLINMVNYYGLKVEIIMMILQFYRTECERGRSIGIAYVNAMAKNWADEGISTLTEAEAKLRDIEKSDRLWNEIVAITGIRHRRPTIKQREMVDGWFKDFDLTMITLASDIMKENIPEPKLAYMNTILKKWKKNGIATPAQVEAEQKAFAEKKAGKNDGKLKGEPTYNLDDYKKYAMDNTDI